MSEFLLEIGSEEIPHWMLPSVLDQLAKFEVLGVPAMLGRTFTDADDARGGGPDGAVTVCALRSTPNVWLAPRASSTRRSTSASSKVSGRMPLLKQLL